MSRNSQYVHLVGALLFMLFMSSSNFAIDDAKNFSAPRILKEPAVVYKYDPDSGNDDQELSLNFNLVSTLQSILDKLETDGPVSVHLEGLESVTKQEITDLLPFHPYILAITSAQNTNEKLSSLGQFSQLIRLDLIRNRSVDNDGLVGLLPLSRLESLSIPSAKVTFQSGIYGLAKLPCLAVLDVSDIDFSAEEKLDLSPFTTLKQIDLTGCGLKEEDINNPNGVEIII